MSAAEISTMIALKMTRSAGMRPVAVGGPRLGFDDGERHFGVGDAASRDSDVRGVDLEEGSGHPGTVFGAALLQRGRGCRRPRHRCPPTRTALPRKPAPNKPGPIARPGRRRSVSGQP